MGRLVFAGATSHVGAILKNPDAHPESSVRLHAAWDRMAAEISEADPDVVLVIATDHYETFRLEHYPTFCLGLAESYDAWGEYGNPEGTVAGAPETGAAILADLVRHGFDVSRSHEMLLDHAFMVPIIRLGLVDRPVLPLFVNCNTAPLPTLDRAAQLGSALRAAVESLPGDVSVAVIATGGVSHWVGLPQFGQVNDAWDRRFLATVDEGDLDAIVSLSDEEVLEEAGNGALEIRTWVAALACAGATGAETYAYEPMPDWAIGIGIVRMEVGA
ncbi:hypothetical protein [Aeromicrobium sp. Leaf350]|uniref:DODA-type extradiol aromatic ring-opening family dioxygenase n=1 Tax=Aeromicrobium sp. Leaf350 TaxID=2876565 RepID=UPI001E565076|nr:hypothetical protein [Aeromicrobium sp. Leaf350]